MVIKNKNDEIVARVGIRDGVLHGHCEWYDGCGKLVAYGLFNSGSPIVGTFLNWARYFSEPDKNSDYAREIYCKDWITVFESGFLSETPKYEMVIEAYYNGQKII